MVARTLIGAIILSGVMAAFAYGWLRFDVRPRISAISICVGFIAFIYAALNLGKAIVALAQIRSGTAKRQPSSWPPDGP